MQQGLRKQKMFIFVKFLYKNMYDYMIKIYVNVDIPMFYFFFKFVYLLAHVIAA